MAQLALIIVGLFMAIPNIMTSEYVDTELMMKGIMNETTNAWSGPEWMGEIKSVGKSTEHMIKYFCKMDPFYTRVHFWRRVRNHDII